MHADCQPDLTLLFDVPPGVSRARLDPPSSRAARSTSSSARRRRSSRACATPISSAPPRCRSAFASSTARARWSRARGARRASRRRSDCPHDAPSRRVAERARLPWSALLPWQARRRRVAALGQRASLAACAADSRPARHRQARARAQFRAGAAVREPAHGRPRLRRMRGLPLRRRGPASGPDAPRAPGDRSRKTRSKSWTSIGIDRVRALTELVAAHEPSPAGQGGRHRAGGADERRRGQRAAEDARGAAAGHLSHPGLGSARPRAGDAALPLPQLAAPRAGQGRGAAHGWLRRASRRPTWRSPRRRARRCARWRWPIRRAGRAAAWLAALGAPERLSVPRLAARIDAGGKDERRARLAHAIDWLIAWTADLARDRRGRRRAQTPTPRRRCSASRRGWRRSRCFAIIARCCSSARCWRIRCNRASSPRRC